MAKAEYRDVDKTATRIHYVKCTIDIKGPGLRLFLLPIIYPALYSTQDPVGIQYKYFVNE